MINGDDIYFLNYDDIEGFQKESFEFICSLFPKFKDKLQNFMEIIDIEFPNIFDLNKLNEF